MKLFKQVKYAVAEAISPVDNQAIVAQIHREFNTAADNALAEANRILANTVVPPEEKAIRLRKLGFGETPEVKKVNAARSIISMNKERASIVLDYKRKYPLHKFIFQDQIREICKKYNLVHTTVDRYKGFVPEKNLKEIEQFKIHPEDAKTGWKRYNSDSSWEWVSDYEQQVGYQHHSVYSELKSASEMLLCICAPQKDITVHSWEMVQNNEIVRQFPDPIVGFKVRHGEIILTAWGEEASDPLVVNEVNN